MQQQISIELRVDFADRNKLPALKKAALTAARHLVATAQLISDTPKTTQIAVIMDDFFHPQEEINLLDDLIATGLHDNPEASEHEITEITPEQAEEFAKALRGE